MPPPPNDSVKPESSPGGNSWYEFRRLVMYRLDTQDENIKKVYACLITIKTQVATLSAQMTNTISQQQELVKDQARRTSRISGSVAGVLASLVIAAITRLIPFR